jgi:hypothetical protein
VASPRSDSLEQNNVTVGTWVEDVKLPEEKELCFSRQVAEFIGPVRAGGIDLFE